MAGNGLDIGLKKVDVSKNRVIDSLKHIIRERISGNDFISIIDKTVPERFNGNNVAFKSKM